MNKKLTRIISSAMFAAFICVATMLIRIPSPMNGYVNLGDCFILASAWILGPVYGFAAAGVGSALADLISGYPVYIPGTFVIKGLMAVAAALITRKLMSSFPKKKLISFIAGGFAAELIMVGGYLLYESAIYGFVPSLSGIPGNVLQGVCGLVAGTALIRSLSAAGVTRKMKAYTEAAA
ncbi:MAG: ECF transporter S component [Ruminococcus sp.]|nr:ECF transporter S component [Oscillospiraceae bacterium]